MQLKVRHTKVIYQKGLIDISEYREWFIYSTPKNMKKRSKIIQEINKQKAPLPQIEMQSIDNGIKQIDSNEDKHLGHESQELSAKEVSSKCKSQSVYFLELTQSRILDEEKNKGKDSFEKPKQEGPYNEFVNVILGEQTSNNNRELETHLRRGSFQNLQTGLDNTRLDAQRINIGHATDS